jgi:uncharacterized protein YecE (DUF72 family)
MWAHRPWTGRFLPSATATGRELHAYSRFVNAVEGNTTFYAVPAPATVDRWAALAEPGFRFVFKVPRHITHELRLRDADAHLAAFVELMAPLGELIGGMTLQLPATFAPVDLGVLESQLRRLPSDVQWSVEVRHPAFFDGGGRLALDRMLARNEVERVLLDSRTLFAQPPRTEAAREAWGRKPRIPALTEPLTDRPIVRFIGSDDPDLTAAGLVEWQQIVADWLGEGRRPTFFVHTPDNADSPGFARSFHADVGLLVPGLTDLPEPLPIESAEQGSLF